MKVTRTFGIVMLCSAMAATTFSCSGKHDDSKDIAEEMNDEKFDGTAEKDAEKLVEAYSANLFEVRMSENASLNASTPEVKNLAMMLVEKHNRMNDEVKTLAAQKQVSLPNDLTEEQFKDIQKLGEKSGLDYDRHYTETMKEKHEKALQNYEKMAEKCENAEIKSWAAKNVTEVREHLDMVMSAHNAVKEKK